MAFLAPFGKEGGPDVMSTCDSQLVSSHSILPKTSSPHVLHAQPLSAPGAGGLQDSGEHSGNSFTPAVQGTQPMGCPTHSSSFWGTGADS